MVHESEDTLSHPEQLSRRISEIDLTDRGPRNVLPEFRPIYTREELLKFRSQDGATDVPDLKFDGIMTPPSISHPNVPPASPADITQKGEFDIEEGRGGDDDGDEGLTLRSGEAKKKKKKKKSSGSGKSKKGVTGFEEFYADPPVTPDEHEEESDLYDQSRDFHERIQTCIQRYRRRRKLDEHRALIITRFLVLGGVEASATKSFTGGLDKDTIEESTADEIAAIQATDFIRAGTTNGKYYDPLKPDGWVVDFEGVVKGFLSTSAPERIGVADHQINLYCTVVKNFLNYILAHAVCPEYTDNILAARSICDLANKELLAMNYLRGGLPGDFNIAASTLYGGRYKGLREAKRTWGAMDSAGSEWIDDGFDEWESESIFKTAIALSGTDEMFQAVMDEDVEIIATKTKFFEIVKVEPPSPATVAQYMSVAKPQGQGGYHRALGLLHVKGWEGPAYYEEDMTDEEDNGKSETQTDDSIETFWLENDILKHCLVGLRMEVVVYELNFGIKFFDEVTGLFCSFHTSLPNEKMIGWKEPIFSTRGPPTEDNPDVEENAMLGEIESSIKEDEKMGENLTIGTNLKPIVESKEEEE